jgi:S1/P1 Nuclease
MKHPLRKLRLLLITLVFLAAAPALAWGPLGHDTIAGLAQEHLSKPAQREVRALLAPDNESTLVDVATWADDLRDSDPARFRETSRMHYVNFSTAQCRYQPQSDCRKGECVVAALQRYQAVLADRTRPRAERADALRFVVHFVADVHQPLHAGFKPDKGGAEVQLRYGRDSRNLHSVWDGLIINTSGLRWPAYVQRLDQDLPAAGAGGPAQWAEESCRVVRDEGVYPDGNRIDRDWLDSHRPIAEQRMQLAAVRLAALIERSLNAKR